MGDDTALSRRLGSQKCQMIHEDKALLAIIEIAVVPR
jgi:hypothetical protein